MYIYICQYVCECVCVYVYAVAVAASCLTFAKEIKDVGNFATDSNIIIHIRIYIYTYAHIYVYIHMYIYIHMTSYNIYTYNMYLCICI